MSTINWQKMTDNEANFKNLLLYFGLVIFRMIVLEVLFSVLAPPDFDLKWLQPALVIHMAIVLVSCSLSWFPLNLLFNRRSNPTSVIDGKNPVVELPEVPGRILDLQYKQLQHDQIYHQDIFVLGTQRKMAHFTLHLSKYGPALMSGDLAGDYEMIRAKLVDSLIILMSCANTLNMSLERVSEAVMPARVAVGLGEMTRSSSGFDKQKTHLLICHYIVHAGQMCKAIEALDHIENFNSRESLESSVKSLWFIVLEALGTSSHEGVINVEAAIQARLLPMEKRHMHHKKLGTYENDYKPAPQDC